MRLVYLSIILLLSSQFSIAQLQNAQPPLFPLTWLQDCTNYFAPLWTEFIPNESKCQKRPRKTYTRRGWDFEGFEYVLGIQDLELHGTRTILHFAKPQDTFHETVFLGSAHHSIVFAITSIDKAANSIAIFTSSPRPPIKIEQRSLHINLLTHLCGEI